MFLCSDNALRQLGRPKNDTVIGNGNLFYLIIWNSYKQLPVRVVIKVLCGSDITKQSCSEARLSASRANIRRILGDVGSTQTCTPGSDISSNLHQVQNNSNHQNSQTSKECTVTTASKFISIHDINYIYENVPKWLWVLRTVSNFIRMHIIKIIYNNMYLSGNSFCTVLNHFVCIVTSWHPKRTWQAKEDTVGCPYNYL